MDTFNYKAKTSSTQHMIDDLNILIDQMNNLKSEITRYIESLENQIKDDRLKTNIIHNKEYFLLEKNQLSVLISDRLLILNDEYISKMIITENGENIKGVIKEYNKNLMLDLDEIQLKIGILSELLNF